MSLAVLAAVLAALLLVRPRPRLDRHATRPSAGWLVLILPGVLLLSPRAAALALVAAALAAAAVSLLRRRRRARAAASRAGRVLETCELVAGELAAGQPTGRALARAAEAWPDLAPVAEAHALGGDVAEALREVARTPGAGDLRLLAGAWVVAQRTGGGLADATRRSAVTIRARLATARLVESELASARATARLVAALPVLAILMGSGSGGDPLAFLVGTTTGLACLVTGLGFGFAGLWWIEAIADDAGRP